MADVHSTPFYNKITRKLISVFGSILNNIAVVRYAADGTTELERIRVPIEHADKEKYIERLRQDPELNRQAGVSLPRIAYTLSSIQYDKGRSRQNLLKHQSQAGALRRSYNYVGVPYTLTFSVIVAVRNRDDGFQIMEQLFPMFTPDYTVSVNLVPETGKTYDIPFYMKDCRENVDAIGELDSTRVVFWELEFVCQAWYIGRVSDYGIIKTVFANTYLDPTIQAGYVVQVNTGSGNGDYKIQDVVFQGSSEREATAIGLVIDWSSNNSVLRIGAAQGTFVTNSIIHGASTNAAYNLASFHTTPLKLATIKITPDPATANSANESHGFIETYTEWPDA